MHFFNQAVHYGSQCISREKFSDAAYLFAYYPQVNHPARNKTTKITPQGKYITGQTCPASHLVGSECITSRSVLHTRLAMPSEAFARGRGCFGNIPAPAHWARMWHASEAARPQMFSRLITPSRRFLRPENKKAT